MLIVRIAAEAKWRSSLALHPGCNMMEVQATDACMPTVMTAIPDKDPIDLSDHTDFVVMIFCVAAKAL